MPRPAMEDAEGYDQKPNPLDEFSKARTFNELDELLRRYWAWAGRPSSRRLAGLSEETFSHATVNKLISPKGLDGNRPFSAKQQYVIAFIRACGGTRNDQMAWVSAWRQIGCGANDQ